ncbi:NUDIX domain-containing protein [Candidatus Uhrbacteria bacterium]|nr:NUDIX domain-containing protein [Candidatus Uhrbacteria bacterium]MBD3284211.1 NUDIX domain-containing protein [Candidatus Uhrbacteria bacterium]
MIKRIYTQTFGVVSAVIERDGKFLLIREHQPGKPDHQKWNMPAGWIDVGEDPTQAVTREAHEETGFEFTPKYLVGIYSLVRKDLEPSHGSPVHPIKLVFYGSISEECTAKTSTDVEANQWFTLEEIEAMDTTALRDIDIKQILEDYRDGKRYPLEIITHRIMK